MAGTIFAGTRFSHLRLWFKAVAYMAVTRCGPIISPTEPGYWCRRQNRLADVSPDELRKVLSDDGMPFIHGDIEVDADLHRWEATWQAWTVEQKEKPSSWGWWNGAESQSQGCARREG